MDGMAMTDDEIRQIITDYNKGAEALMQQRDERLRAAIASGRKQADLVRLTEMSREAMRQALDPAIREAVRKARAEKRRQEAG
jgi:pyrroline-5-carboxylate reductase